MFFTSQRLKHIFFTQELAEFHRLEALVDSEVQEAQRESIFDKSASFYGGDFAQFLKTDEISLEGDDDRMTKSYAYGALQEQEEVRKCE